MRLSAGCKDAVTFEIEFCSGRESLVLVASLAIYVVRGIALAILAPFVVTMRHRIHGASHDTFLRLRTLFADAVLLMAFLLGTPLALDILALCASCSHGTREFWPLPSLKRAGFEATWLI
jgi:hypothetical protein